MRNGATCPVVGRAPGKVSGTWVFAGTRIPLSAAYENLACGATVEEFLKSIPGVDEEQVRSALEQRGESVDPCGGALKLLSDQGTPTPLRHHLLAHFVDTLAERAWSDKVIEVPIRVA